jgi:hypothetical protein
VKTLTNLSAVWQLAGSAGGVDRSVSGAGQPGGKVSVVDNNLALADHERDFTALHVAHVGDQRARSFGGRADGRGAGSRRDGGGADRGSTGTRDDEESSPSVIVHDSTSVWPANN